MTHLLRLQVLWVLVLISGCTCAPVDACGPELCASGCCDAMGVCVGGQTEAACGAGGEACGVCTAGDVCTLRQCLPAPVVPLDAGLPARDAGVVDAGVVDAGTVDAGVVDAGAFDAGQPDAGAGDAGLVDAGAAVPDAGAVDGGAAADAGVRDAGLAPPTDGGLLCRAPTVIDLTYDFTPVTLTGTLTLNGQTLPTGPRGSLEFTDLDTGALLYATLATSGPATFSLELLRGTYDVRWVSLAQTAGLPPGRGAVARGVVVTASSTQSWNVNTVNVSGTVTYDGVAPPGVGSSGKRGLVTFRDAAGQTEVSFSLPPTGPATYSGQLFTGTFDVEFSGATPAEPRAVFARALPFTASSTRVDDLRFGVVTATVSLNGQSVNWQALTGAALELVNVETNQVFSGGATSATPSVFTVTVPQGAYDVFLRTYALQPAPAPARARALLARAVSVGPTANFAWQVRSHELTATLTLDGLPFPERGGADRGSLWFHESVGSLKLTVPLPTTGPATVTLRLAEGVYDIGYETPQAPFAGVPGLRRVVLARGVALTANTTRSLAPQTATLDVSFSVDGVLRTNAPWYDGLTMENDWAGRDAPLFPLGVDARMPVLVYRNSPIDVFAFATPTAPTAASGAATLLRGASFAGPQVLPLNATTVQAAGVVTLNGQPLPDGITNNRGAITVFNFETGGWDSFEFGPTGPVAFPGKRVFAGPVDVVVTPLSEPFPYRGQSRYLARACLASACRTTSANVTGTWMVRNFADFPQFTRFQLVESSSGLSGDVTFTTERTAIDRASRVGNSLRWTTSVSAGGNDAVTYIVELESPCRMRGTVVRPGYGTSRFIAIR